MGGVSASEEELKVVHVTLTRIKVSSFSMQDETVTLEIHFKDETPKQIYRTTKLHDKPEIAANIIKDIIRMEENINMEFDGVHLVDAVYVVLHRHDDSNRLLMSFLQDLQSQLHKIKNASSSEGYMDMVRTFKNSEIKFYG